MHEYTNSMKIDFEKEIDSFLCNVNVGYTLGPYIYTLLFISDGLSSEPDTNVAAFLKKFISYIFFPSFCF